MSESITTARAAGCTGTLVLRDDSAFYSAELASACRAADVRFSVTAKLDPKVKAAIAAIGEDAWTPVRYPRAIFDEQAGGWASDAEGRRNHLHRVHQQEGKAGHCPADRAPGQEA
ncbi:hypothetical protein [Nonomuraea rubra]|uniref:hypothetical protein n=1 Tax=Nonomuraea rubra TaxID=46180 RepID=UPI0033E07871